jgi:hypothetical protein
VRATKARSPILRPKERPYTEWDYDTTAGRALPQPPESLPRPSFFRVLRQRESRRTFARIDQELLATLLWFTAKTWRRTPTGRGARWEHRATPSAGGRHPIDTLLFETTPNRLWLYDSLGHCLRQIRPRVPSMLRRLRAAVNQVLPVGQGTILLHAAQLARTAARYRHPDTLVWRDAGALVATTALVAEALGLSCCPLGITGEPFLSEALGSDARVLGVGGCIVGKRIGRQRSSIKPARWAAGRGGESAASRLAQRLRARNALPLVPPTAPKRKLSPRSMMITSAATAAT